MLAAAIWANAVLSILFDTFIDALFLYSYARMVYVFCAFCNLVLSTFFLCYSSRISCLVFCAHSWNWWYSFCESVSSWYKFLPYFFEWCYVFLVHWTYFSILYYLYYHRKLSFFFLFRCVFLQIVSFQYHLYLVNW